MMLWYKPLTMKRLCLGLLMLTIFASAHAQQLAGTWTGKMSIDLKQLKAKTEEQAADVKRGYAALSKMKFKLTLNKDMTFTSAFINGSKTGTRSGTYKIVGNTVVLRSRDAYGAEFKPLMGTFDKKKKTLTFASGGSLRTIYKKVV
jgi:hypothetical protein